MSFGNKSFTGSLVKPLVSSGGSSLTGTGPVTVVAGGESFYMDVKDSQDCSVQVVVGAFGSVGGGTNVIPAPNVTPPPVTCIYYFFLYILYLLRCANAGTWELS